MVDTCFINMMHENLYVSDDEVMALEGKSLQDISAHMTSKYMVPYQMSTVLRADRKKISKRDKSDEVSSKQRKIGNGEFARGNFEKSLKFYHDAISYAKSKTNLAYSYGNISAVLFRMKKFKSCLIAIEKVKDNYQIQDNFFSKILEREQRCLKELENPNSQKPMNKMQLKYPANPKNPEIVDCIEVGPNGGVFAKQSMKAGDIIAITKPFIIGPFSKNPQNNEPMLVCESCCSSCIDFPPIPCEKCESVLYCDENCRNEDLEFHKLICRDAYDKSPRPHFELMALKFTAKLLLNGIDIRKSEFQDSRTNCFNWDEDTFENRVKSISALKTVKMNNFVTLDTYLQILVSLEELKKTSKFEALLRNFEDGDDLFFQTYLRGFKLIYFNYFTSLFEKQELVDATHFDLMRGFFNHSCSANVVVYSHFKTGLVNYYILTSNVRAGEELTVSYG